MEKTPAEPRLSATILMLRDAASGPPEVLMVKRHYEIDFAAGALVFPGGKASAEDSRSGMGCLYRRGLRACAAGRTDRGCPGGV